MYTFFSHKKKNIKIDIKIIIILVNSNTDNNEFYTKIIFIYKIFLVTKLFFDFFLCIFRTLF